MTQTPEQQSEPQTGEKPKKVIVISDADSVVLHKKLRAGRFLVRACYVSLLALFTLLNLINENGKIALWLLQIIPLLIFVPALLRETHRTYSWLCFVALMYFAAIIPLLMSRWLWSDWLITLLVSVMFIAAMMTSRWLQYWNYYLSTKSNRS
jgi:uncharacterized membrane protein